jgi:CTP:molybdopterin cytidylyltransferase MocA
MGRPKQLLPLGGRPLLQRTLDEAAASCLDELILVLGHRSQEILDALQLPVRPACRVVVNRDYPEGQSSSLMLGLGSTDPAARAAAILLGDQPFVTAALIDRVAEAFLEAGSRAARPVYAGAAGERVPGHPVFLARSTWAELARLDGDRGARDLLRARPDWLHELPLAGTPPVDIDTLEDWQRAQKELSGWH